MIMNTKQIFQKIQLHKSVFITICLILCCLESVRVIITFYQEQQNYMWSQKQTIEETLDENGYSPKPNQSTLLLNTSRNKGVSNGHIQVEPTSQTQKKLFQRSLVKEIILKGRARTLSHQVGKIDKNTCLYAKPSANTVNSVSIKRVPPSNNCHLPQGTTKFHQTITALKNHSTTFSPKNRYYRKGLKSETKNIQTDFRSKRVTLSGLLAYKFTSVNAQRSLSSNKINYEQKLKKDIKLTKQARDCQYNRYKKILLKQSKRRYKDECQKSKKIVQSLDIDIDSFLQKMQQDDPKQKVIYGEKIEHLSFIKQFMKEEKKNYSDGKHIIDSLNKKIERKTQERHKTQYNYDLVFENRTTPQHSKGLKVRYFTFLE